MINWRLTRFLIQEACNMTVYGYVRVSTKEQHEDRQLIALADYNIAEENLYVDKISGKDFERPAYQEMLCCLEPDDFVIVKSIDRLGRNYAEIQEQWRIITKEKCADIKVVDTPLLDTTYHKDLLGTFIADLVLTVMSYTAQNERDCIRQRQEEGIEAAKERGVHMGRPQALIDTEFNRCYMMWIRNEISLYEFGKRCGFSRSTLYRKIQLYEEEEISYIDLIKREKLLNLIDLYSKEYDFKAVVPVSAEKDKGTDIVIEEILKLLPNGPKYYDDEEYTDQTMRDIASEIIREKALKLLNDEVPHGIYVEVESFKERKTTKGEDIIDIDAVINCLRESHKGIIIGKGGNLLKRISTYARQDLEKMFDIKINLKVWVKVKEDWQDKDNIVNKFKFK